MKRLSSPQREQAYIPVQRIVKICNTIFEEYVTEQEEDVGYSGYDRMRVPDDNASFLERAVRFIKRLALRTGIASAEHSLISS